MKTLTLSLEQIWDQFHLLGHLQYASSCKWSSLRLTDLYHKLSWKSPPGEAFLSNVREDELLT